MVGVLDDRYMRRPGMICNVHPCFDTSSGQVGLRQQELDGLSAAPCVKDGGRSSEREVIHELASISIVWTNIIFLHHIGSFSIISDQRNTFHYVSHVSFITGECGGICHFAMSML